MRSLAKVLGVSCFAVIGVMLFVSSVSAQQKKEWNQWRGPDRNGHSLDTGLLEAWPEGGPEFAWSVDNLGEGYSNFSFWGDKIFSMGDIDGKSRLFALSKADGKKIWSIEIGAGGGGGGFPGPKCTPTTNGKLVVALNQFGDLVCADIKDGKIVWRKNMGRDFGGEMMSGWGYAESPLLLADSVICTPGGNKGAVVSLDLATGKEIWRCTELTDKATYSSIVPAVINKTPQLLVLTEKSMSAVNPKDGKLIWTAPFPGNVAVCSDPVFVDNNVMAACAYGVGAYGYSINEKNEAKEIFADKKLENHHGGIIQAGGYYYLLTNRELVCLDPKTGEIQWSDRSVGKGSIGYADGNLILRSEGEKGTIALVAASPLEYAELGRFEQPDRSRKNSWTHPIIVDGRMYIRDQGLLLVYEVK